MRYREILNRGGGRNPPVFTEKIKFSKIEAENRKCGKSGLENRPFGRFTHEDFENFGVLMILAPGQSQKTRFWGYPLSGQI